MSGSIVLMGLDAEDDGPGGHGPITVYENVVNSILSNVTKSGLGILVIGGGKASTDDVTMFWDAISTGIGVPVTYVNGSAIATQPFSSFLILAVTSSIDETPSGGLTDEENNLLTTRKTEITNFINSGGGLIGFSQTGLTTKYAYLGGTGTFITTTDLGYEAIAPTAAGQAIGITDDLDICCWHDVFDVFPSFLQILALDDDTGDDGYGRPAAIGGAQITIPPEPSRGILLFA